MRILHLSNYASTSQCKILHDWCLENEQSDLFINGKTLKSDDNCECFKQDKNRRIATGGIKSYPQEAVDIHNKLRKEYPFLKNPMEHWTLGILAGVIHPPGDFYPHVDDNYKSNGLSVVGFNLLVSQPEGGGVVTVGEQSYHMKCGDLMAYLITDYRHSVSAIGGNIPRVMWYWRFYVDKDAWENQ